MNFGTLDQKRRSVNDFWNALYETNKDAYESILSSVQNAKEGDVIKNIPIDVIFPNRDKWPDGSNEWEDAEPFASMTDDFIIVMIRHGDEITVQDGHNRLKTCYAKGETTISVRRGRHYSEIRS